MATREDAFPIPTPDPKRQKKIAGIFLTVTFLTAILGLACITALVTLGQFWLFGKAQTLSPGFLMAPILYLSSLVGTAYCRRKGLSQEKRITESIICRADAIFRSIVPPAQLSSKRSEAGLGVLVFGTAFALGFWLNQIPHSSQIAPSDVFFIKFIALPFMAVGSLYWAVKWIMDLTLIVRVDSQGITFTRLLRKRLVRWEEIGQVDLITRLNVYGDAGVPVCVLRDPAGKQIARFSLSHPKTEQRDAFVQSLRQFLRGDVREAEVIHPPIVRTYETSAEPEIQRLGQV